VQSAATEGSLRTRKFPFPISVPLTFCDGCYAASYADCEDLTFPVGLTPSTAYKVIIENHFGQKYSQTVTSDTGGAITVDIDQFPTAFFSPYGGFYTLEVRNIPLNVVQTLVIGYSDYQCISFDIYDSNTA
jgi:hypothetical protein